jgi:hypothetical protein
MQLAIVGSRDFRDEKAFEERVKEFLSGYNNNELPEAVVSGGATGADTLAKNWAKKNGVKLVEYKADFNRYGKAAGPIRNALIVKDCTHVLAFPSRHGKGTQDTIKKALCVQKVVVTHFVD